MPLRLLVTAERWADRPDAEVVVFDFTRQAGHTQRPHPEARLWRAPQHEEVERSPAFPFHSRPEGPGRYLRLNAIDAQIDPATFAEFDGIVLGGVAGSADLERLGARLAVAEAEGGLDDGALRVVALIDTPRGMLSLPALSPSPRLAGIACDPGRLTEVLGCAEGAPAIVEARALTVLAAAACGVPAILVASEQDERAEREGFGAILLA